MKQEIIGSVGLVPARTHAEDMQSFSQVTTANISTLSLLPARCPS